MNFKTKDHLETICPNEMGILSMKLVKDQLVVMTEGGIIRGDNSNNNRFEDVYCTNLEITFSNVEIKHFYAQGFKYYDANGKLLKEAPDVELSSDERKNALVSAEGGWLFCLKPYEDGSESWSLIFDAAEDEEEDVRSFEIIFTFKQSMSCWERFTGPVEK